MTDRISLKNCLVYPPSLVDLLIQMSTPVFLSSDALQPGPPDTVRYLVFSSHDRFRCNVHCCTSLLSRSYFGLERVFIWLVPAVYCVRSLEVERIARPCPRSGFCHL